MPDFTILHLFRCYTIYIYYVKDTKYVFYSMGESAPIDGVRELIWGSQLTLRTLYFHPIGSKTALIL